jgi:hypothetical protein
MTPSAIWSGSRGGGRPFSCRRLFEELLPSLSNSGFTDAEIAQLIIQNPQNAYAVRVREAVSSLGKGLEQGETGRYLLT